MPEAANTPPSGLTIAVLGPLSVRMHGAPINLGGRRESAVLVALLLGRRRAVSTDALIDAVWAGHPPATPQATLQAYISHLRKRLDPDGAPGLRTGTIERVGAGYALNVPEHAVDAWRFETLVNEALRAGDPVPMLTDALALWRGAALSDYADGDWAKPTADRWTELAAEARERLYAARVDRGDGAVLIAELEAFVEQAPLREERWRLLALALYRAHRQADALAALRRVRALLADELGVDPAPALRSLEKEILEQSVTPAPVVRADAADRSSDRETVPRPAVSTPAVSVRGLSVPAVLGSDIVERDGDLAVIDEAVRAALGGEGRVILIEGPAGIGKTQLLRAVRRRVGPARVLVARGSQLEREYGFGVVRQLLEPIVTGAVDSDAIFSGAAAGSREVFAGQGASTPAGDTLFGVLHGLYWLTAGLAAEQPLMITVDDVQWCDVGSLRLLGFLAHRLEGLPIALVLTLRTGEQHANDDLLAEIVSEPSALVVTPKPLSRSGVLELVQGSLGDQPDEAFVAACRRTTGGNPLLLRQLLKALESDGIKPTSSNVDTVRAIGSRAVSSLVLRRFARMPADNRAAARAIAILGDGASLQLVAELTGLPTTRIADAIGALARAEVLRHEYPLAFVHPLVHDAVYGDIPLGSREMQHEQAARLLAEAGAAAEQIAAHLLKIPGRGDEATVTVLLAAAARSAARGAPDGAVAYLKRALDEPASARLEPQVYLELGRVETMTDVPAALDHLTAAYKRLTDIRERAHAAVMLGRVELFAGTRGHSREIAESIIDEVAAEYVDERQWLQAISRISSHMHVLGAPAGEQPGIVGGGPGARSLAATLAWETTLASVDRHRAINLAEFALAGGVLDEADQAFMGVVARNVLEVAEAAPPGQWDDALAKAYRKGSLFAVLGAQVWGGYAHWNRGDLEEAQQWLRNCTEQNELWGAQQIGQTYTDAFMAEVLVDLGDLAGAQALLDAEPDYWRLVSEGQLLVQTAKARVLLHRGLLDQALTVLDRIRDMSDGVENPAWRSWQTGRAMVLAAAGRSAEAIELARASLVMADRWGTARGRGRVLRILGTALGDQGVDELRAAVNVLQSGSASLELAKALAALGARLAPDPADPPSAEAVDALRRAYLLAAGCGAAGLQARLARRLSRLGQEVPVPPRRAGLTTTEREITRMSVEGAFDQEIAQALFITTSTVRQTLDGVRQRLGVSTAQELRALVAPR